MKKQFKFLHEVTKSQYLYLILLAIFTASFVMLNLIQPMIFAFVIDNIINLDPIDNSFFNWVASVFGGVDYIRNNLWIAGLLVLFTATLAALSVFLRTRINGVMSENVAFNIKNRLFDHLMHLPYKYYVSSKSGDLIQRGTSDIDTIRRLFAGQISEFIYAVSIVSISFVIMINKNIKLALIAAILLPIIFSFAIIFFIKVQKDFNNFEEAESALTHAVSENLAATRVIKAFNREAYESKQFEVVNRNMSNAGKRMIDSLSMYWGVSDFFCFSSILLVLVNAVIMVSNETLTVGDAFVFVSYTSMMVWPLRHLGRIIADLGRTNVALKRIIEVIDEPIEQLEIGVKPLITGEIELIDVHFKYSDDPQMILKGINMHIRAGQTIAILGPTGSGKSTLIHLLMGLYDYSSGSIKLNGVELRDISKHHLRENVAIVLQEPFLFSKSIKENIVISKPDATDTQITHAANIAHVDEFINKFDLGYETMIGERGTTLSGGQKQRVAIARTIVNEYPIIIFDDSLSAVDTETDANIRQKLSSVKSESTKIIITQRVASSKDADYIFVIENGLITQAGVHDQLVLEDGLYKRISEVQSKIEEGKSDGK